MFDFDAFVGAYDAARRARGLGWYELAAELWEQSHELNDRRPDDHPFCGGALSRQGARGATSCQYALHLLRWIGRPPEDFLHDPVELLGDTRLLRVGADARLRWDLGALHSALDGRRRGAGLTWTRLAAHLECTPARLTNLRTARTADLELAMRVTQWLHPPAADFVHAAT